MALWESEWQCVVVSDARMCVSDRTGSCFDSSLQTLTVSNKISIFIRFGINIIIYQHSCRYFDKILL